MGILSNDYETVRARLEDDVCFVQIHRPEANNAINERLIEEIGAVLRACEGAAKIVVLEGTPDVFCSGADFQEIRAGVEQSRKLEQDPEPLYDLWRQLASGRVISVAHVQGRANAGGIGFVAACDIVISDSNATYSLSELLFGLMPACVLPFLIRRVGFAKANFMTLTTQPICAAQAQQWGLVDVCEDGSEKLLRKQLLRLRRLGMDGVARYKRYANSLDDVLIRSKPQALAGNLEVFSDPGNLQKIARYVRTGQFPWE